MRLEVLQQRLDRRLLNLDAEFTQFASGVDTFHLRSIELFQLEGIISTIWQVWCRFCRSSLIESALGAETSAGAIVRATYVDPAEVAYVAKNQRRGKAPLKRGRLSALWQEPTWGDVNRIVDMVQAISPANRTTLLAAFGTVPDIDHMRLIRNGASHRNGETLKEVLGFMSRYSSYKIWHPLQAVFWIEPKSRLYLVRYSISEMRAAARNSIR